MRVNIIIHVIMIHIITRRELNNNIYFDSVLISHNSEILITFLHLWVMGFVKIQRNTTFIYLDMSKIDIWNLYLSNMTAGRYTMGNQLTSVFLCRPLQWVWHSNLLGPTRMQAERESKYEYQYKMLKNISLPMLLNAPLGSIVYDLM